MEKESLHALQNRFLKQEKSLHQLMDNLLELSSCVLSLSLKLRPEDTCSFSNGYKPKFQETSLVFAGRFRNCLSNWKLGQNVMMDGTFWMLSAKSLSLWAAHSQCRFVFDWSKPKHWSRQLLAEDTPECHHLGASLRDILLQESSSDLDDMEHDIRELVGCACDEARFGISSGSREIAFDFLVMMYFLPPGRNALESWSKPGKFLENAAKHTFCKWELLPPLPTLSYLYWTGLSRTYQSTHTLFDFTLT